MVPPSTAKRSSATEILLSWRGASNKKRPRNPCGKPVVFEVGSTAILPMPVVLARKIFKIFLKFRNRTIRMEVTQFVARPWAFARNGGRPVVGWLTSPRPARSARIRFLNQTKYESVGRGRWPTAIFIAQAFPIRSRRPPDQCVRIACSHIRERPQTLIPCNPARTPHSR